MPVQSKINLKYNDTQ
jgi:hypothetical protein